MAPYKNSAEVHALTPGWFMENTEPLFELGTIRVDAVNNKSTPSKACDWLVSERRACMWVIHAEYHPEGGVTPLPDFSSTTVSAVPIRRRVRSADMPT